MRERKQKKILITKLRRITLPPKLTYLCNQELSLFYIMFNKGSHVDSNCTLAPTGNPDTKKVETQSCNAQNPQKN